MRTTPLVALDVGTTKVACAVGLPREHALGYELLGHSLVPYASAGDGWLADPLETGRAIEQAVEATGVSGDFHEALVTFSHPQLHSERVNATVDLADEPVAIRARDLERLAARAGDHALAIDREPLVVERVACAGNGFHDVPDPTGLSATRLHGQFIIITMPSAARRALIQAVEFAGLDVMGLRYSLEVFAHLVQADAPAAARLLLVDLGGLQTDVGLSVGGRLVAAQTLAWGGLTFAHELARALRLNLDHATALTLEGLASRKREVREALAPRLEALEQAIRRVLENQPAPDAVRACGRGVLIDGFVEWIERTSSVKTTVQRSARTQAMTDLARQIGTTMAIALLEHGAAPADRLDGANHRLAGRASGRPRAPLPADF